jgi:hypothetical protein
MPATTAEHPPGATLHLGGDAWAAPSLEPLLVPIEQVTPWPGNPRRHDQAQITGSVRDHGLYAGVVVQLSSWHALVGHGRRQALIDLGADRIPATPLDVDDLRGAAIVARDNKTHDDGGYDEADQLALLDPLAEADLLALAGFNTDEYELLRSAVMLDFPALDNDTDPSLDTLDAKPCPKCGYDLANDPESLRTPR